MVKRGAICALLVGLLGVVAEVPQSVWAAPCVTACKDEVTACRAAECATLTGRLRRKCKRRCAKTLVHDCYTDLAVCGATQARPSHPSGGGSGGGSGGW